MGGRTRRCWEGGQEDEGREDKKMMGGRTRRWWEGVLEDDGMGGRTRR